MRRSTSKVAHRPASSRAGGPSSAVFPDPDAPVTTKSGSTAAATSNPQTGQRAAPPRGSSATAPLHDWQ
jgi:hypothetical protein